MSENAQINWREYTITALQALHIANIDSKTPDAELLRYLEELKKGRTWVCSTCDINLFSWESCCD